MPNVFTRVVNTLPQRVGKGIKGLAIATLVGQIVLIGTGGLVRLTSSGLGCPTWPRCTADSVVNTPEMGIHGVIEFGNRMLTFVLTLVVIALLVSLWRLRKQRSTMFWLTFGQLVSIPVQAVVGGISVLTGLNPWVVGLHFLISAALVVLATLVLNRAFDRTGRSAVGHGEQLRAIFKQFSIVAFVLVCITVALGVMVTGSGPHAGDATAPRNGFQPYMATRIHVVPVYLLVILTVLLVVLARRRSNRLHSASLWLLLAVVVQAVIGYTQYFTGVPGGLVELHMLGAGLLLAAGTNLMDVALRGKSAEPATRALAAQTSGAK